MARKYSRQAKAEKKAAKAAKSKQHQRQTRRDSRPSYALLSGLDEAETLLQQGDVDETVEVLKELARRYPRRTEVLNLLLIAYLELDDMWSYQSVAQQLIELHPNEPDLWLALAGAALGNGQLAVAYQAFNHVLSHWPSHDDANKAGEVFDGLESFLREEAARLNLQPEEAIDLLILHDEINLHLHLGDFDRVIAVTGRLLARCPTFAPALNNRGEAWFRSGSLDQALADARRVLEFSPDNFHALGNLARYSFYNGDLDAARDAAERLKSAQSDSPDLFTKQAEALATLGDWHGVLDTLQRAKKQKNGDTPSLGLVYHLAGVAAAELGQLDDARRHWKQAVKKEVDTSVADWAQANLDDLKLPTGEQNGPWAFPIERWIPRMYIEQLLPEDSERKKNLSEAAICRYVQKFLQRFPFIEKLAPTLLQHGDEATREFFIRVLSRGETPAILSALRDFAFGQRGSDALRYSAALCLVEMEALDPGSIRLWIKGEQRDVNLMSFEISSEPTEPLPKNVESLSTRAWQAIHEDDGAAAESLLDEALKRHPEHPSLIYNRAVAIQLQGRKKEAMDLVRELHARCPDYLFANIKLAEEAIDRHDFDAARELLNPLMSRRRFHQSEYAALCHAHIQLLTAQGEKDGALAWLKMWEDAAPDDERIMLWQARLNRRGLLSKLFK